MPMTPRDRFTDLSRQRESDVDLGLAAALVAAEHYPALDVDAVIAELDRLAAAVAPRLEHAANPLERLRMLVDFLRVEVGLRANTESYYDPRNSFLNEVLARGLGIPISLAVVYLEVARRVGIPLRGVGFPQHFLMKHGSDPEVFLDPFAPDRPLGRAECVEMLGRVSGGRLQFDDAYLEPVSNRQIIVRMLTNLKLIFLSSQELDRAIDCIDRILIVSPDQIGEFRDRGRLHAHLGNVVLAQEDLESYLMHAPTAPDAPGIQKQIDTLRAQVGTIH
jgi:regulator of sirC expression with transglutaminase-like and TPR domain